MPRWPGAGFSPPSAVTRPQRVNVVPHTHWDREWYPPFQTFRLRLVDLLDDAARRPRGRPRATPTSCSTGRWPWSTTTSRCDPSGRPSCAARLARRPRRDGSRGTRCSTSSSSPARRSSATSQLGLDRAASWLRRAPMAVGYLPDMFGHVAQMPQLLAPAGFDHAVVWRGVPRAVDRTGFWWEAPDGTTVRAEYLPTGYGNGAAHAGRRRGARSPGIDAWIERVRASSLDGDPILWMNGTDHLRHQPGSAGWWPRPNARCGATSTCAHVAGRAPRRRARPTACRRWRGELRCGARANLLMGVASNRVDVRQAAARAERALERLAEPLWARCSSGRRAGPGALLDAGVAGGDPQRRPRLDLRLLGRRGRATRCSTATPRPAQIGEGLIDRAVRRARRRVGRRRTRSRQPAGPRRGGLVEVTRSRPSSRARRAARSAATPGR